MNKTVINFAILSALTINGVIAGGVSVSISPDTDKAVKVDGSVNFSCSASGGCPPYEYSWSFENASGNPPTDQKNPGSVAFGSGAEGKSNTVSVTVTDDEGGSDTASVSIIVPKIKVAKLKKDGDVYRLWFFNGTNGEDGGSTQYQADDFSVEPSNDMNYSWTVSGPASISEDNGTSAKVKSTGASQSEGDVIVKLKSGGSEVANAEVTVHMPDSITLEQTEYDALLVTGVLGNTWKGWETRMTYRIENQFQESMPATNMFMNEKFDDQHVFVLPYLWGSPFEVGTSLLSGGIVIDTYNVGVDRHPITPSAVWLGDPGDGDPISSWKQSYHAGSEEAGKGTFMKQHRLYFRRGFAETTN